MPAGRRGAHAGVGDLRAVAAIRHCQENEMDRAALLRMRSPCRRPCRVVGICPWAAACARLRRGGRCTDGADADLSSSPRALYSQVPLLLSHDGGPPASVRPVSGQCPASVLGP